MCSTEFIDVSINISAHFSIWLADYKIIKSKRNTATDTDENADGKVSHYLLE